MRIAVIGAGNVGTTLGSGWAVAGHQVAYGVRDTSRAAPHAGATMQSVAGAVGALGLSRLWRGGR